MVNLSTVYNHIKDLIKQFTYTKSEVDTALSGKSDNGHTHNYTTSNDVDSKISAHNSNSSAHSTEMAKKVNVSQGTTNSGKFLKVNNSGNVACETVNIPSKTSDLTNDSNFTTATGHNHDSLYIAKSSSDTGFVKSNGTVQNISVAQASGKTSGIEIGSITIGDNTTKFYQQDNNTTYTPASATPLIESYGGTVGTSAKYAREDHAHPHFDFRGMKGTNNTVGYVKCLQIKPTSAYQDKPIAVEIFQRDRKEKTVVQIKYDNLNSADPTLQSITHTGQNINVYLYKSTTSTWELICSKGHSEKYGEMVVKIDNPNNGITITSLDTHVDTLPTSNITQSTYIGFTSSEKTKLAGIENNANNYSHPLTHDASMITGLASNLNVVTDANGKLYTESKNNHTHGNITNDGKVTNTASSISNVVVTEGDVVKVKNKIPYANLDGVVSSSDARLSDARTPKITEITQSGTTVVDINDAQYCVVGFYSGMWDDQTKYIIHTPRSDGTNPPYNNNKSFFMVVENLNGSTNYVKQTLTYYDTNQTYTRTKKGNTNGWSSWVELSKDTNTTYTGSDGIRLDGTTFKHTNTGLTPVTTSALKKIKYDAQGHITGTDAVSSTDLSSISGVKITDTTYTADESTLTKNSSNVFSLKDSGNYIKKSTTNPTNLLLVNGNNVSQSIFAPSSHTHNLTDLKDYHTFDNTTGTAYYIKFLRITMTNNSWRDSDICFTLYSRSATPTRFCFNPSWDSTNSNYKIGHLYWDGQYNKAVYVRRSTTNTFEFYVNAGTYYYGAIKGFDYDHHYMEGYFTINLLDEKSTSIPSSTTENPVSQATRHPNYPANTIERLQQTGNIECGENLIAYKLVWGKSDNKYYNLAPSTTYDVKHLIYWIGGNYNTGTVVNNIYSVYPDINLATTKSDVSFTNKLNRRVYVEGIFSNGQFTTSSDLIKTDDDTLIKGNCYISIGMTRTATNIRLNIDNNLYIYNGVDLVPLGADDDYESPNLLPNTKIFDLKTDNGSTITGKYNDCNVRYLQNNTSSYKDFSWTIPIEMLETDAYYTLSFWAKSTTTHRNFIAYFYNGNNQTTLRQKSNSTIASQTIPVTGVHDGSTTFEVTPEWKRYFVTWKLSSAEITALKTVTIRVSSNTNINPDIYLAGVKFEKGDKPTKYSEYDSEFVGAEVVWSTHTSSTSAWTGTCKTIKSIKEGTVIYYQLRQAPTTSPVTLTLTLANGKTHTDNVYFGDVRLTNQYNRYSLIGLVYDGSSWGVINYYKDTNNHVHGNISSDGKVTTTASTVGNVVVTEGDVIKVKNKIPYANLDGVAASTHNHASLPYLSQIKAGENLTSGKIIYAQKNNLYYNLGASSEIYVAMPLYKVFSNVTSGNGTNAVDVATNNYAVSSIKDITLTTNLPVYIEGDDYKEGIFKVSSNIITQTPVKNKYYMYIGTAANATTIRMWLNERTVYRYTSDNQLVPVVQSINITPYDNNSVDLNNIVRTGFYYSDHDTYSPYVLHCPNSMSDTAPVSGNRSFFLTVEDWGDNNYSCKQTLTYFSNNTTYTRTKTNSTTWSAWKQLGQHGENSHNHSDTQIVFNTSTAGYVTPIDLALYEEFNANRLAFLPPENITVKYSTNRGSTWTNYNTDNGNKIKLVSHNDVKSYPSYRGGSTTTASTNNYLQIIIDAGYNTTNGSNIYTKPKKLYVYFSTQGCTGCKCQVDVAYYNAQSTFSQIGTYNVDGYNGWNSIPFDKTFGGYANQMSTSDHVRYIRLTFYCTGISTNATSFAVSGIKLFGENAWLFPSVKAKHGHMYSYDENQIVTFPSNIVASKFIKNGVNNTNLLMANGGDVAQSTFATAHSHPYLRNDTDTTLTNGNLTATSTNKGVITANKFVKNGASNGNNLLLANGNELAQYTADESTLTKSNANVFSLKDSGNYIKKTANNTNLLLANGDKLAQYTGSDGVSVNGTSITHGATGTGDAQTTSVFKKIKYDAKGHITGTDAVSSTDLSSISGVKITDTTYTADESTLTKSNANVFSLKNSGNYIKKTANDTDLLLASGGKTPQSTFVKTTDANNHAHGNITSDGKITTTTNTVSRIVVTEGDVIKSMTSLPSLLVTDASASTYTQLGSLSNGASQYTINKAINDAFVSHTHRGWDSKSLTYSKLYYNDDLGLCELILARSNVTLSNTNTWLTWENNTIPANLQPSGMITTMHNYGGRAVVDGRSVKLLFTTAINTATTVQASFMWHY